jgi:hypothetical protein
MTLNSIVLYLPMLAALGLVATLSFAVLSPFHIRRASTLAEACLWFELVPRLPLVTALLDDANGGIQILPGPRLALQLLVL